MEIVSMEDLKKGDKILIEGFQEGDHFIRTVKKVYKDGILTFDETPLDFAPEDPEQIVRLGRKGNEVNIRV